MKRNRVYWPIPRRMAFVCLMLAAALCLSASGAEDAQLRADLESLERPLTGGSEYVGMALAVKVLYKPLPEKMPGSETDTPEMVALGRRLYFEPGLSLTKTQSCNDCHRLDDGGPGAESRPVSKGAKGTFGERNAQTVLNAGFHTVQFWDGRAANLIEQAKGPVLNPKEMAMACAKDVEDRLKTSPMYRKSFALAFPGAQDAVTFDNIARAIAAFERTLVSPSRFDRFLKGDPKALTLQEKRGLVRFVNTGCIECHTGSTVGGRRLEKVGRFHAYANRKDTGRFAVTKREEDRFVFKVPSLRNATLTAPYFHDGKAPDLNEAVRLMAWMQLNRELKSAEIAEIVTFLGALEGEKLRKPTD